jgi:hypothetical protein
MAQTFLISAMGNAANDGSGDKLRTGGLKIVADLTELYAEVAALQAGQVTPASLIRSQLVVSATGAPGQVVPFTSQFVNVYALAILDYNGIGITVTAQDEDGFTIESLSAGNFGYIAMIEQ